MHAHAPIPSGPGDNDDNDNFIIVDFNDTRNDEEIVSAIIVDKHRKRVVVAFRGSQSKNELGLGHKTKKLTSTKVVFENSHVVKVSLGQYHSCIINNLSLGAQKYMPSWDFIKTKTRD